MLKMTAFDLLKQEIQSWYPDYEFTEYELTDAVNRLIKFFTVGVEILQEQKKTTPSFMSETGSDNS